MAEPRGRAGEAIRRLRTARGMSQRELAGDRYTPQYISVLESARARPSEKALIYIANRLGVSPGSLLDGEPRSTSHIDIDRLIAAERALEAAAAALRDLRQSLLAPAASSPGSGERSRASEPSPDSRDKAHAKKRSSTRSQPALQVVIEEVLRAAGEPLPAQAITERVIARGWTPPRSGHELRRNQVYARTGHKQYRHLFTRSQGLIGLVEWNRRRQ